MLSNVDSKVSRGTLNVPLGCIELLQVLADRVDSRVAQTSQCPERARQAVQFLLSAFGSREELDREMRSVDIQKLAKFLQLLMGRPQSADRIPTWLRLKASPYVFGTTGL